MIEGFAKQSYSNFILIKTEADFYYTVITKRQCSKYVKIFTKFLKTPQPKTAIFSNVKGIPLGQ